MAKESFSIHTIPETASDKSTFFEYSSRLKKLRLESLKSDPDSWISVFESEVDQPPEFWFNRLSDPRAVHLVLVHDDPDSNSSSGETSTLLESQWVGFVVIITPENDSANEAGQPSSEYIMSALYVDSDFRGRGLGRRLVQATIQTVRDDVLRATVASPVCITNVRHGNDHALRLYQKLGFEVIDSDHHGEKEGRPYKSTMLRINL